jgi:hypothetical protein
VEVISAPIIHEALASAQDQDDEVQTLLGGDTALRLTKLIPGNIDRAVF